MTTENKSIAEPAGSTTESSDSTTESPDSTTQPSDSTTEILSSARAFLKSLVPADMFVPLLTGLPPLDEMLVRHHVPRRGLVYLDCARDIPVDPLIKVLCSQALGRGEKVACIAVTPPQEREKDGGSRQETSQQETSAEDREEEWDEEGEGNAHYRSYCVPGLLELNDILVSLVRQLPRPDLIVVAGIERVFHPDALSLAEPPLPIKGLVDHWYKEVIVDSIRRANRPFAPPATSRSEGELRARLARVYLCQWLGVQGSMLRSTTTSLWLVPSPGTPSPANSLLTPSSAPSAKVKTQDEAKPQAQAQGEGGANDTANDPSSDESLAPFSIGMRQVLDMYCDYSVRWGAPTVRLDAEGGRVLSVFPLALLNFGLPLDEAPLTHSTDIDFPDTPARAQGEEPGEEEEETTAWTPPAGQSFRA